MTALTNREKNIMHEARQAAKIRPAALSCNFAELEAVVRNWVASKPAQEELSPFETVYS